MRTRGGPAGEAGGANASHALRVRLPSPGGRRDPRGRAPVLFQPRGAFSGRVGTRARSFAGEPEPAPGSVHTCHVPGRGRRRPPAAHWTGLVLGGARPKAAVRDRDGGLAIAKFPHREDDRDIVLWEGVTLGLAGHAGIRVPDWRIEHVAGRRVLIVRRFDRDGDRRLPFLSAMSMLGSRDNEPRSYLEIADGLRSHGAAATRDLAELWRRVAFNVLVSNTDDHLRNHGFLYEDGLGWRLSPGYDLNPTPTDIRPRVLATNIDEHDGTARGNRAPGIAGEVGVAVATWREEADGADGVGVPARGSPEGSPDGVSRKAAAGWRPAGGLSQGQACTCAAGHAAPCPPRERARV